jgi:hypothetical protein
MRRIEQVKWLEAVPLHQRAFREQRKLPRVSRDHRALSSVSVPIVVGWLHKLYVLLNQG